jgi:hypothetical protein
VNAGVHQRIGAVIVAIVAGCLVVACSSTTQGQGSAAATFDPPASSPSSAPASTSSAPRTSTSASATVSATASLVTTIAGSGSAGGSYKMSLWAHDVVNDCGAHSHGAPIISYFAAHPCRSATRRLWTTPINGRTLALSIISVSAEVTKVNENPDFSAAQTLVDLENADGTGSVNDLLSEGKQIPGGGTSIPANEVFSVSSQDGLVVIVDAWYLTGSTNSKDATIAAVEDDLSFSDASAPDAD